MNVSSDEQILRPVDKGARALGVGLTKFWALIGAGEIETVRIGRRRMVVWASLEAYVERLREAAKLTKAAA